MRRWQRVGVRVLERRRERGFRTQRDFAEALGVSRRTVAALERGEHPVSDDTVAAVERVLGWAPGAIDDILAGKAPTVDPAGDFHVIERAWPELTARERVILLAVLEALRSSRD
jgi:transcriptional regulator with XRE-family HTH domain